MIRRTVVPLVAVMLIATACSSATSTASDKGPRPVTSEEAGRLATMGVKNFQDVGVAFRTVIVSPQGAVSVNGDVNFHTLTGYGEVSTGKGRPYTVQWDGAALLAWPSKGKPTTPPTVVPVAAPRERALSPATSSIDTVLALLLGLGVDRADGAKQIQQGGARWLGTKTIDGQTVDVMQGPSAKGPGHGSNTSLDFWVDASGHLLRVDIYLSGSTTPTQIDLDASTYAPFRPSPYLTSKPAG